MALAVFVTGKRRVERRCRCASNGGDEGVRSEEIVKRHWISHWISHWIICISHLSSQLRFTGVHLNCMRASKAPYLTLLVMYNSLAFPIAGRLAPKESIADADNTCTVRRTPYWLRSCHRRKLEARYRECAVCPPPLQLHVIYMIH